jgi:Tfp pilus assembly protein PilO
MVYTNPTYQGTSTANCPSSDPTYPWKGCTVKKLKELSTEYDTALTNSRELQEKRDALGVTYNSLSKDDLTRLSQLLPDNADNIRLIINIQQMAQSYGLTLATIKFDAAQNATGPGALSSASAADVAAASRDYGSFDFTFSTTATYENFLTFMKDVESNLRLTDIESVDFSAADPIKGTTTFTVKLRTYWLKS